MLGRSMQKPEQPTNNRKGKKICVLIILDLVMDVIAYYIVLHDQRRCITNE